MSFRDSFQFSYEYLYPSHKDHPPLIPPGYIYLSQEIMWACGKGGSITPLKMPMLKARSEDIGLLSVSKEDQQIQMKYYFELSALNA